VKPGTLQNIASIQVLRAIAALMVVVHHLGVQVERLGANGWDAPILRSGVDLFFVISGFIMWVTSAQKPGLSGHRFFLERLTRIAPIYWVITAFVVVVALLAPRLASTTDLQMAHVLKSALFIPAEHPVTGRMQPVLIPGWTLNMEMFFYFLFAMAVAFDRGSLQIRRALIALLLGSVILAGLALKPTGVAGFYTNSIVAEFGFGIAIGVAYEYRALPKGGGWWVLILIGIAGLALDALYPAAGARRALVWGGPAALIVAGAVFGPAIHFKPLEHLGDWSYSLYLSHPIALSAAGFVWRRALSFAPIALFPVAAVAGAVVLAAIVYRWIEVPVTTAVRRLIVTARPLVASPTEMSDNHPVLSEAPGEATLGMAEVNGAPSSTVRP
jgi:peptidoglycan/LPS O-acetylase OafA/YrhL